MAYNDLFSFYRSSEWESLRKRITLERVDGNGDLICEHCKKPIVKMYDAICHHVQELTESNVHDAMVSLNPENIQVVHHRCHNKIHERWQGGRPSGTRHIYVVWGSPCAGKSDYVQANAGRYDLVVDIDRLYDAMGVDGNRGAVKTNVLTVYRSLMDMVKTRNGKWRTAWIVRTLPYQIDRERIVKEIGGAELIHLDTDEETCMTIAKDRGGEWEAWVEDYWRKFQP